MPLDLTATKELVRSPINHFRPDLHKRPKYSNEKFTRVRSGLTKDYAVRAIRL